MPYFRKRPVVVKADQWLGPGSPLPPGLFVRGDDYYCVTVHDVETPVEPGDWLIIESRQPQFGQLRAYPCKPDIFEKTYEWTQEAT